MIPRLLQIVGLVLIIAGVIIGMNSYEIPATEFTEAETSMTVLFTWIAAGLFSGLTLIGIGEIIYKLEELKSK